MKTSLKLTGLALMLALGFGACEKDYVTPGGVDEQSEAMLKEPVQLESSTWHIVSFQWHNREPNNNFDSYMFSFGKYGNIYARHQHILQHA